MEYRINSGEITINDPSYIFPRSFSLTLKSPRLKLLKNFLNLNLNY